MGILTDDVRRVVEEPQLGFIATICPDGTPNLSPKGTTGVHGDDARSAELRDFYLRRGSSSAKLHIVVMRVATAAPLISPASHQGHTEAQTVARWRRYWDALWTGRYG